jgi:hypothetical protein
VLVFPCWQREERGGGADAAPAAVAPSAPAAAAQPPDGGEEWARGEGAGAGGLPSFARGNPWLDILARRR